jgi:hypothetical protein
LELGIQAASDRVSFRKTKGEKEKEKEREREKISASQIH